MVPMIITHATAPATPWRRGHTMWSVCMHSKDHGWSMVLVGGVGSRWGGGNILSMIQHASVMASVAWARPH